MIGGGCRHDNNRDQGAKSATVAAAIIDEGEYEVRLLYVATNDRAKKVPVTIQAADGDHPVTLNQREECIITDLPKALGVFKIAAGKEAKVSARAASTGSWLVENKRVD